jgi:glutamate N-acetyltransferase/amino-acid N-acetyltransferase
VIGVAYPREFRAAAVEAAIKKPGRNDLAVIFSESPAAVAGVFTRNLFAAAPVEYCRRMLAGGAPGRAVVVNAGNANAGTGADGLRDSETMASLTARGLGIAADEVYVSSTGVIGRKMPMDRVADGIARVTARVKAQSDGLEAARAIMTTDTVEKHSTRDIGDARLGGMCKGAGMIHPDMATMLAYVTTDAAIPRASLQAMLSRAVEKTFNAISVDNDTSTNDTLLLLANGVAGAVDEAAFEESLTDLCRELSLRIVADGEGATKIVTIEVKGATSDRDAALAADAVATSMLVKTALYGNDPNWGRILAAVGRSGASIDTDRVRIAIEGVVLFEKGLPTVIDLEALSARMRKRELRIEIEIGLGGSNRTVYTTDLTKEYVAINAEYTT